MSERFHHELDKIKKLAMASNGDFFSPGREFLLPQSGLANAFETKEEADRFLAELDWVIKQAQAK